MVIDVPTAGTTKGADARQIESEFLVQPVCLEDQ